MKKINDRRIKKSLNSYETGHRKSYINREAVIIKEEGINITL